MLKVLADADDAGGWVVRAPAVGVWTAIPSAGSLLAGGATVGWLVRLNTRVRLVLPADVAGRVTGTLPAERAVPLGWNDELFRLVPVHAEGETDEREATAEDAARAATALVVRTPTDGVFYSRPAPDREPFVKPGDTIRPGQTIGLVEVMKTFHQILFDGEDASSSVRVVALVAEDGAEVVAGQPLVELAEGES
jgi:biotin carboxyl carrier protein